MSLKITTWNLEHANRLVSDNPNSHMVDRRLRVRETIEEIAPDILCIQEGPKGERAVDDFCTQVFDREWVPIFLDPGNGALGDNDKVYQTKGTQWIWFLVKPELAHRCRLQSPQIWQAFVGAKTWPVNYWGEEKEDQPLSLSTSTSADLRSRQRARARVNCRSSEIKDKSRENHL